MIPTKIKFMTKYKNHWKKEQVFYEQQKEKSYHICQIYIYSFVIIKYFLLEEMQRSTSFDKKTQKNPTEIWAMAKDLQRIINSQNDKSKLEESESSIEDQQSILALCHKIIDILERKSSKENGKKVTGKANSKESEYSDKYNFTRTKQLTSIIDPLLKQTKATDEKNIITKVKSMNLQIQFYHKFIDFILEYPKIKTFPVQQQAIPHQQQEKIKQINTTYLQLTTKIKELQQFRSKSKVEGDKDSTGTIRTLLIQPISILLKERTEEKNRKNYINTVFTNLITANFKPIQSEKYGLDHSLTEHLSKLSIQLVNISNISSEILEKVKGCLDKYHQAKNIKKTKKTGLVNLLQIKTKIDEVCQFLDMIYNLPLIKQKYGIGEFSHLSEDYKTRLDIYSEMLRKSDKLQEESKAKIIDNEKQKLFDFVSQICKVMNGKKGKGNNFIAKNVLPDNLHLLVDEVKSMKSQVESSDSLTREVVQKNQIIKNFQDIFAKSKEKKMLTRQVMFEIGMTSLPNNLLTQNFIQSGKAQKNNWQDKCAKCNELFVENSGLIANNKLLQQENETIKKTVSQKEMDLQEIFQRLADILPSNQRLCLNHLSRDDIIQKIISYNKSLVTKYQQRQRSHIKMSENIKNLQKTINTLNYHINAMESDRVNTNQKLEESQKLGQRLAQINTLLANREETIQNLQQNIKDLQQEKQRVGLHHKQEVSNLQLNASNYPQQIQDLKKENKLLIDQLYFLKQNESKIYTQSQQDNTDRIQLINEFNQKIEFLEQSLLSKQEIIEKFHDKINEIVNKFNEAKQYNNLIASSIQNFKEETSFIINRSLADFSSQILSLEETIKQQSESYNILMSKNDLLEASNTQLTMQAKISKEFIAKKLNQLNRELKIERDNADLLRQELKIKDMEIETMQMNIQLTKGQSQGATQICLQVQTTSQLRKINLNLQQQLKRAEYQLQQSQGAARELQMKLKNKQQEYNTKLREEELKKAKLPEMNFRRGGNDSQLREILRKEITERFQEELISLKEHFNQSFISMLREQGYYEGIKQITPFSMLYIDRLFQGNIFQDKIHYKYRILQHLSTLNSCRVQQTKLIYKMDPRNNTNFHVYIDNTPDMLCVVMTKTGTVIAGYYSGVYQNAVMTAPGLLITVTKNESFVLRPNNRAMVYDPYFIIFGNAEFRVRSGEASVFCNFGIMNSYYDHKNKKVVDFLCAENNREVDIEYFEIFQIIYEA